MQQYADIYALQNHSHVSGVTAAIIRLVNKLTHTVSSFQLILAFYSMTCTGSCGYSF